MENIGGEARYPALSIRAAAAELETAG